MAREELVKARAVQKGYYDRRCRLRKFAVGDKCLVLLPTASNKLLATWKGPYEVKERINDLNYILMVEGQRKRFHVNMMKRYFERAETTAGCVRVDVASDRVRCLEAVRTHFVTPQSREMSEGKRRCLETVKAHYAELHEPGIGAAVVIEEEEEETGPSTVSSRVTETFQEVAMGEQLSHGERCQLVDLLAQYAEVFSDKPGIARVTPHRVQLTTEEPVRVKPYPIPLRLVDAVRREIEEMEAAGLIEKSSSPYCSPLVVVKKKEGGIRLCGDYRRVNAVTRLDAEPMADPQTIFATLANSRIFTKLDLVKGYYQIPLSKDSRQITAFSTPAGLYQYKALPFGMTNSPAAFNKVMRQVMHGVEGVECFVDDLLVHAPTFEQHLATLRTVMERLRQYNLTVKPSKCMIGHAKVPFLGHVVGGGQNGCQLDKIVKVRDAPRPQNKTQVKSFLGLAGYYRDYIPHFAIIAAPLHELLKRNAPNAVKW